MERTMVLRLGFAGNLLFFILELIGGLWSGSWALITDALHLASDTLAMAIAWWAEWFSRQPSSARYTFGREKIKAFAALGSVLLLAFVVLRDILPEAIHRLFVPEAVKSLAMLGVALVGLGWNGWLRRKLGAVEVHQHHIQTARIHVDLDYFSSYGVVGAAAIMRLRESTGLDPWLWLDPAASLMIVAVIAASSWPRVQGAVEELIDKAPPFPWEEFERAVLGVKGVVSCHELHLRAFGKERSLTAHILRSKEVPQESVDEAIEPIIHNHGITHHTIRVETVVSGCCECLLR